MNRYSSLIVAGAIVALATINVEARRYPYEAEPEPPSGIKSLLHPHESFEVELENDPYFIDADSPEYEWDPKYRGEECDPKYCVEADGCEC